jgi:hypothetical protein
MSKLQSKQEAEKLAAQYLLGLKVGRRRIDVDVSVDRREGDYWYILVKPRQSVPDTMNYYYELGKIETKIYRETGEELLFVPAFA